MRPPWKILSAALIAGGALSLPGSAGATPLSSSLALKNADATAVETVQWRRRHGRWIGPGAGFAAGVAVGSAFAPRYYDYYGYDAYAYDPGYAYAAPRRYRGYGSWGYQCTGDESVDSANPSWACPPSR